jgi:hypothetical protein
LATLPNFKLQIGPQQPVARPVIQPFGFPAPVPAGMPGGFPQEPFPNNEPFEEMRRAQEKSLQDFIQENERQMKEFNEQLRQQHERPFGPGF